MVYTTIVSQIEKLILLLAKIEFSFKYPRMHAMNVGKHIQIVCLRLANIKEHHIGYATRNLHACVV